MRHAYSIIIRLAASRLLDALAASPLSAIMMIDEDAKMRRASDNSNRQHTIIVSSPPSASSASSFDLSLTSISSASPSSFDLSISFAPDAFASSSTPVSPPLLARSHSLTPSSPSHSPIDASSSSKSVISNEPFGFLSFPCSSLPSTLSTSSITLSHIRSHVLPHQFPSSHIAALVSSGVLSSVAGRALASGNYYFVCANGAGGRLLPASTVQEHQIRASACRPGIVLRSTTTHMSSIALSSSSISTLAPTLPSTLFTSKDTLPLSLQRRSSFDITHQDTSTLLDTGIITNVGVQQRTSVGGTFSSPRLAGRGVHASLMNALPMIQLGTVGGSIDEDANMNDEERHRAEELAADRHDRQLTLHNKFFAQYDSSSLDMGGSSTTAPSSTHRHRPHRSGGNAASGITHHHPHSGSISEYPPLAAAVHFDDLIREKVAIELSPGRTKSRSMRITVTGEIKDANNASPLQVDAQRAAAARRNTTAADDGDDREGSVRSFTNVEDFIRDEERRRRCYDVAAADYASSIDSASTDSSLPPNSAPSPRAALAPTPLWISVEDGDEATLETLGRYFGLHPLTIEDCQSRGIREKLEVFPEYLFLVFHALEEQSSASASLGPSVSTRLLLATELALDVMQTTPLKLVVFPSLVLSFHHGGLASVLTVRRQLTKLYLNRVLNTAWLIHGLLDVVSDALMPVVDRAAKEADDMEDLIYVIRPGRESHKDVLKRMGFIARRLTFLRQRLWSKRDILTSLIERDWQFFLTGVKVPYLRDIYDHLVIMLHKLDSAIEVVVTLQSTYLAVVSIDVAAVANDGNASMKTLSAAATILLPLSLIASLMGMNVTVPFQAEDAGVDMRELMPFIVICVWMGLISYYLYIKFKKRQYL